MIEVFFGGSGFSQRVAELQRDISEISAAPCVASKGADFNVLHECLSDRRAFCSILHRAESVSKLKKLYKRGSSRLINNKHKINA